MLPSPWNVPKNLKNQTGKQASKLRSVATIEAIKAIDTIEDIEAIDTVESIKAIDDETMSGGKHDVCIHIYICIYKGVYIYTEREKEKDPIA